MLCDECKYLCLLLCNVCYVMDFGNECNICDWKRIGYDQWTMDRYICLHIGMCTLNPVFDYISSLM